MARRRAKEDGSDELQEMQEFLADDGADEFDVGAAIYWFANDYYSGQGDPLYAVMDLCGYKPGARTDSIDDESEEAQDLYKALEGEFGDGGGGGGREAAAREAVGKKPLDIDDEEVVLKEMAKALDTDVDDLKISSAHYEDFGAGTVWEITLGRNQEYYVVADDDVAYDLAIEIVKQDLGESPENFNQDFLARHIDEKKLRKELEADEETRVREDFSGGASYGEDFWGEAERQGMYVPEEDEDGERRDPTDEELEELIPLVVADRLKDPIEYLSDIYGKEDAMKQAIKIAGIDEDAAAKDAVDSDGAGHYLSSYDSATYDTPGGFTYWRHN